MGRLPEIHSDRTPGASWHLGWNYGRWYGSRYGGSAAMALVLWAMGWGRAAALAALAGGVIGMILDSLLGATLQRRQWCERCKVPTERGVHSCGAATRADGGLPWLDNDGVNALSTFAGACTAVIFYRSLL